MADTARKIQPATPRIDPVGTVAADMAGRDPRMMGPLFAGMDQNPFVFFRASAPLFMSRLVEHGLPPSPLGWMTGDLHVENVGAYRDADGEIAIDLDDYDEAALLPGGVDLVRLMASILSALHSLGMPDGEARSLAEGAQHRYAATLAAGEAQAIDGTDARGVYADLVTELRARRRAGFIAARTVVEDGSRAIITANGKALPLRADRDVAPVIAALEAFARTQPDPAFFAVRDVVARIAGAGSRGTERYLVLVRGKGAPASGALIDLKHAMPPSTAPILGQAQPAWPDEATRVVTVQARAQASPMALLASLAVGDRSFVVRELQPRERRLELADLANRPRKLASAFNTMASLAASSALRTAGWKGADTAKAWRAFGRDGARSPAWLAAAVSLEAQSAADHAVFAEAWQAHDPRLTALTETA